MSPKVSTEYEQRQRRRIVQAAIQRFSEKGFHRATIQDICEAADLSKGAVYLYFKSKEELLAAIVDESVTESLTQAGQAASRGKNALEKLEYIAEASLARMIQNDVCAQSPQLMLEIWAEASKNPQVNALCARGFQRWRAFLADLLREGVAEGTLKPWLDPDALAAILVAVFDGLTLQESITRAKVEWRAVAATLSRGLGEGVVAEPAASATA